MLLAPVLPPSAAQFNPIGIRSVFEVIGQNFAKIKQGLLTTSARGKIVSATYDLTTASGNQNITGFGFNPQSGFIFAGVNGASAFSMGMFDGATMMRVSDDNATVAGTFSVSVGSTVRLLTAAGASQVATVTLIDDGIRLVWSKTGAPTGTAVVAVLAFP